MQVGSIYACSYWLIETPKVYTCNSCNEHITQSTVFISMTLASPVTWVTLAVSMETGWHSASVFSGMARAECKEVKLEEEKKGGEPFTLGCLVSPECLMIHLGLKQKAVFVFVCDTDTYIL